MSTQYIPYHSPALFDRAMKAAKNNQGVEAAILGIATIEALMHDFAEWLSLAVKHKEECPNNKKKENFSLSAKYEFCLTHFHKITNQEIDIYRVLIESEKSKKSIAEKCILLSKLLTGNEWSKGAEPMQSFIILTRVRNDIIHTKGNLLSEENGKIKGYPRSIDWLFKKNLIDNPNHYTNWLNLIDVEKFCEFVISTILNIINSLRKSLPKTYMSSNFSKKILMN
jgi:hypothetical protein